MPGGGEGGDGTQEERQEDLHVCVSQMRGLEKLVWWNKENKSSFRHVYRCSIITHTQAHHMEIDYKDKDENYTLFAFF